MGSEITMKIKLETCPIVHKKTAQHYMENAKTRDSWDSFLYGLVLTMGWDNSLHSATLSELKKKFPTPYEARKTCSTYPLDKPSLPISEDSLQGGSAFAWSAVCLNSADNRGTTKYTDKGNKKWYPGWNSLDDALYNCKRKDVQKHFTFQKRKGADMMLLEAGCETPVIDRHVIRMALSEGLSHEQAETTEFLDLVKGIQAADYSYDTYKQWMLDAAERCHMPAGQYHVAKWYGSERVFGKDKDKGVKYLDDLIHAIQV